MTRLFVFLVISSVSFAIALQCGPNEIEVKCPSSCGQYCPDSEDSDRLCKKEVKCEPPACQCIFNHRRNKNGTCIPTSDCSPFKCKKNEEYVPCPTFCPTDDCNQATPDGSCPYPGPFLVLTVIECSPACRCLKGYWRKNGECVPYNECH